MYYYEANHHLTSLTSSVLHVISYVFCTTTCHFLSTLMSSVLQHVISCQLSRLLYYNMSTLLTGQHSYFIERRHYTGRSRSLSGDRLPRSVSPSVTMISPRSSSTKRVITEENPYTSMRETTETSGLFLYSSSYQNGCWGHAWTSALVASCSLQ